MSVRVRDERVLVRLRVVARPGQALGPLTAQVRTAVAARTLRIRPSADPTQASLTQTCLMRVYSSIEYSDMSFP